MGWYWGVLTLERSDMGAEVYLAVADAEFFADVFAVEGDGLGTDAQATGDVLGAFSRSYKPGGKKGRALLMTLPLKKEDVGMFVISGYLSACSQRPSLWLMHG